MSNFNRDVFWSIVGRKKAGSDVTKTIKKAKGRRGNPISWNTVDRWIAAGLLARDPTTRKLTLTELAITSKRDAA